MAPFKQTPKHVPKTQSKQQIIFLPEAPKILEPFPEVGIPTNLACAAALAGLKEHGFGVKNG